MYTHPSDTCACLGRGEAHACIFLSPFSHANRKARWTTTTNTPYEISYDDRSAAAQLYVRRRRFILAPGCLRKVIQPVLLAVVPFFSLPVVPLAAAADDEHA